MAFHVGSIADLIHQKAEGDGNTSKLFQNLSDSDVKAVKFKLISTPKRKRVSDQDEAMEFPKEDEDDDGASIGSKRFKGDNSTNAARRVAGRQEKINVTVKNPEHENRTIFVGNLPCNIKVTKLKKLFKSYGKVESARLRCAPVKDPKIPKRVAVIRKEFHPERTNIVGFVRFSTEEEAVAALQANGLLYEDHHLRVDLPSRSRAHDQKKAVFVGNLQFGAEEDDLWKFFEACGEIDGIRIVRDSHTGVGKGFAFVNFKDRSSVELATKMDGQLFREREIRVTRAVKKVKVKKGGNLKVGREGQRQKVKGERKRKKPFRGGGKRFEERGESSPKVAKRRPEQNFRRGGEEKFVGRKQFWEDTNEVLEKGEKREKVKKPKLKLKSKPKVVKKSSDDEPSFLGNKTDEKSIGKVKKGKLSKSELKKKVLAVQLQMKKCGIESQ